MSGAFAYLLNAFLLTTVLIMGLRQVAVPLGLVDRPDARKRHDGLVPLCGGLALFASYLVATLSSQSLPYGVLAALVLLVLIGTADDRWNLPPWPRLAAESAAAAILIGTLNLANFRLGFALPDSHHLLSILTIGVTLFFCVGMMNAVNMSDGVDGLAGGSAAIALFFLALIASQTGSPHLSLQALLLLSATVGFLVFNLRHPWRDRAAVFLGEAGSITMGAALAYLVLSLATGEKALAFTTLIWVVVVPVIDTLSLVVRRLAAGRSPLSADRWHLHHLLLDTGFTPARTTGLIALASALCGVVAYVGVLTRIPGSVMLAGLLLPAFVHTALVLALGRGSRPAGAHETAALSMAKNVPAAAGQQTESRA
jgi:UDP-GlcNAc:undecaprenyl-phosphate GlcNAc-1-phosphate transferase